MTEQERRALYPGSFDPPTNGHKWVMEQITDQFDKGYVSVGFNPEKPGRFPVSERVAMLEQVASQYPNIIVNSFLGLLQADFAEMVGAKYIVRGTRNANDFAAESDIRHVNTTINPQLEMVIYVPPKELLQVSSSMVMGLVGLEGWETEVAKMVPEPVLRRVEAFQQEKDRQFLKGKFKALCERTDAKGNFNAVFEDIYTRYSQNHRSYHNTSHLKMCLNELELVKHSAQDLQALEFALFYHDAVYNSSKEDLMQHGDDEGESAELAITHLTKKLELPLEFAQRVASLILVTKHLSIPLEKDHQMMVDIDLAILGRSSRLFDLYEQKVRQEYYWVPWEKYSELRIQILQGLLSRRIYSTSFFIDRYGEQAKRNLQRSIQQLSQSQAITWKEC